MVYNRFLLKILIRVLLIFIISITSAYIGIYYDLVGLSIIGGITLLVLSFELYRFVSQTNKKLSSFLKSIKYSDFITRFSSGNQLDHNFKELNEGLNSVMEAIRKARSEKEEHLQYLNIVVEHVSVGVISFDYEGNVGLMNAAAKKLMQVENLRNIEDLIEKNSRLYKILFDLPPGKSSLFKTKKDIQLSVNATEVKLGNKGYKLIALQNIQPELQKKELEAWQNLTKILRHEIMNSITPISSLTSTLKDILKEELQEKNDEYTMPKETADDLAEGLLTIEDRSKGLIKFINAYRDYTSIPQPDLKPVSVQKLFNNVLSLMKAELNNTNISVYSEVNPITLEISADEEQIEQVLINMVKNSIEALKGKEDALIQLEAEKLESKEIVLKVRDNGSGIIRGALEKIFIPFYTTKDTGSGIGLAWSRQIMQLHHGTIQVQSEPDKYTQFTLTF